MGRWNFLVEGVSGTGKTTVCDELARRGFDAVHGDRALAYQGDPVTGTPTPTADHDHHVWDLTALERLLADDGSELTFLCGGSRNLTAHLPRYDGVFVLQVDRETLLRRLDDRPPEEWGAAPEERALVLRLHETQEDVPADGVRIDATAPVGEVADAIVAEARRVAGGG